MKGNAGLLECRVGNLKKMDEVVSCSDQIRLITADSDNPAVCHDEIEHQSCAGCSGLLHDDESSN